MRAGDLEVTLANRLRAKRRRGGGAVPNQRGRSKAGPSQVGPILGEVIPGVASRDAVSDQKRGRVKYPSRNSSSASASIARGQGDAGRLGAALQRQQDYDFEVVMTDDRTRETMDRSGYVYVLSTAFTNKAVDLPIIKIGRTSRTPSERNKELSRGGPAGMKLVGAVTTMDAVGLEQKAHRAFSNARFIGGGGSEYFTANPDEVLAWLRAEAPRFEIDSARNAAWHDYVESRPWKMKSRLTMFGFGGFIISLWLGGFLAIVKHEYVILIAMPFIAGGIFACLSYTLSRLFLPNIEEELKTVRSALEEQYHLPPGRLLAGPAAGYKHRV